MRFLPQHVSKINNNGMNEWIELDNSVWDTLKFLKVIQKDWLNIYGGFCLFLLLNLSKTAYSHFGKKDPLLY